MKKKVLFSEGREDQAGKLRKSTSSCCSRCYWSIDEKGRLVALLISFCRWFMESALSLFSSCKKKGSGDENSVFEGLEFGVNNVT